MLISWTKLLFTLIVNKRKIQNKLKSLFLSLILGFRPAAKRASTSDETAATDSPPAPKRCHVDTPTTSSMPYSSLESMGELMDTEDTQQPKDVSPPLVSSSGGNNNKEANEHTVASSNPKLDLTHYEKWTVEQNQTIKEKILFAFKSVFPELQESAIHNYYFCLTRSKCDICELDKQEMTKDKKFQHKGLFDSELAKCSATEIWFLVYIDGKGMFCSLCHCTNMLQPSNESKVWNCEPNVRYRPDNVRNHMYPSIDAARTLYGDAIQSELLFMSSFFVTKEKEIADQCNGVLTKVLYLIYWLCKEEVAHSKLNSILKLLEIVGLTDIKDFTKRSNTVLKELFLTLGDQLMEDIIQEIKKSNVYGLLTGEVTDLTNALQLVTFIKYYDQNLGDARTCFVDVSDVLEGYDVLEGSMDTTATAETIHDFLINLLNFLNLKI